MVPLEMIVPIKIMVPLSKSLRWAVLCLLPGILVLQATSTGRADVIQIGVTFGPYGILLPEYVEGTTFYTDTRIASATIPKFDPAFGQLNAVVMLFQSSAEATVFGFQSSPSSTNFVNANMRLTFELQALHLSLADDSIFFNETPQQPDPNFAYDFNPQVGAVASGGTVNNLQDFVGPGQFTMSLRMSFAQNAFSSSSFLRYRFYAEPTTEVVLLYDFTPVAVPEPAGCCMVCLIGCCAPMVRVRRMGAGRRRTD